MCSVVRRLHLPIAQTLDLSDNVLTPMFDPSFAHPEYIDREPVYTPNLLAALWRKTWMLCLVTVLSLPFWPLYLFLRIFFAPPPIIASATRVLRCMQLILFARPPQGPPGLTRLCLFLDLVRRVIADGFFGFAWYVDEIIWGRQLRQVKIVEPLFEVSAARSGSTQIAHYLEDDIHLCAPVTLQIAYPFIWMWRIAPYIEPLLPRDWQSKLTHAIISPEHHERHEVNPLRTDTFEILFLMPFHLGNIFTALGVQGFREALGFSDSNGIIPTLWEDDFVEFIDALGRKTLLEAKPDPSGHPRRFFIKGHFLQAIQHLADKYPDGRFLTVVRAPEKRFQSLINFMRCNIPADPSLPTPWAWLVEIVCTNQVDYCDTEMQWYSRADGPRRCVIRFDDYVKDLEGTMRKVYRECLDRDVSPHVPRIHTERTRSNYSIDRSLKQLGIDEVALKTRLEAYRQWCKSAPATKASS